MKVALNTITLTIFHIKSIPKQEKSIINNDLSNTINLVFTLDKYYKNQQKIFIEIAHCIEYYKNKQNIYIEIARCYWVPYPMVITILDIITEAKICCQMYCRTIDWRLFNIKAGVTEQKNLNEIRCVGVVSELAHEVYFFFI